MDMIETKNLAFAYPADEGESRTLALRVIWTRPLKRAALWWCWDTTAPAKSTFAKSLNAMLLPCGGKVYVEGMDTQDEALSFGDPPPGGNGVSEPG